MGIYAIIKSELDSNVPLYGALSDQEVADELNAIDKPVNKTSISGAEIWERTDSGEYAALTDTEKSQWLAFCAISSVDPFGTAVNVVTGLFGGGSVTATSLNSYRIENVSRASILGIGIVTEGDIVNARNQ